MSLELLKSRTGRTLIESHRGIEADDGEFSRHMEDILDNRFADIAFQKIELGGIVPGGMCTVVAMVEIAHVSGGGIDALEDDGGVAPRPVTVLDTEFDPRLIGKIGAGERIVRERAVL